MVIMSTSTLRIASDESIVPIPRIHKEFSHFLEIPRNLQPDSLDVPLARCCLTSAMLTLRAVTTSL
ncbi:hypothetical protein J2X98_002351 [Pseudarthrobacter enclensis]|uniref:Uncharacterized protein n=1 Tax=Pseudarthrobacter enclensis TaxID=993070 RepID=A0ABT9RVT4_9MICC|nr:hypothetical protein [Pseudarthrobacter enclensis]